MFWQSFYFVCNIVYILSSARLLGIPLMSHNIAPDLIYIQYEQYHYNNYKFYDCMKQGLYIVCAEVNVCPLLSSQTAPAAVNTFFLLELLNRLSFVPMKTMAFSLAWTVSSTMGGPLFFFQHWLIGLQAECYHSSIVQTNI